MFKDKVLLITGGTGSFGNAVLKRFINSDIKEIRIFSRDEKKQDDMRRKYLNSKIKYFIGDVRDKSTLANAMKGVDYVFHASALKQVPSCEFYPIEAVKTNIIGTENVLQSAIENNVEKVIVLSTDKASYPINAMGISKAMMERVAVAKAREQETTKICITRYGNVMASRGSVIPLFSQQIDEGRNVTVTDPYMTRFMMTLEDAVDLVLYAFEHGESGDLFVQKAPACTIGTLVDALKEVKNAKKVKVSIIGKRHGEKSFETLVTREEMERAIDLGNYFRVPADFRTLQYEQYAVQSPVCRMEEYNSDNTKALDKNGMIELLKKLDEFK